MKLRHLLITLLTALLLASCGEDSGNTPSPKSEGSIDLWIPLTGLNGTMQGDDAYVILKTDDLSKGVLDVKSQGVDITASSITPNIIYRNGYYYSVSRAGNFGKFKVTNETLETIKEIPVTQVLDRRFAHAWIDDSHIVLLGSTGKKQTVTWVRIDTDKMVVEADGTLDIETPKENESFNSSGMAGYRKSDGTLFYIYVYMPKSKSGKLLVDRRPGHYIAFIDAKTMKVKKVEENTRAQFIGSTSYGDTRTQHTFTDANGNFYYIACNLLQEPGYSAISTTRQASKIFRINNGEDMVDPTYEGYQQERGKIVDLTVLNNEEVLLYVQDPKQATPDNPTWDSKDNAYTCFWQLLNYRTHEVKRLDLPLSRGVFGNTADIRAGKVYIGINVNADPSGVFFIYDVRTRKVTKGASLASGYEISRIKVVK